MQRNPIGEHKVQQLIIINYHFVAFFRGQADIIDSPASS